MQYELYMTDFRPKPSETLGSSWALQRRPGESERALGLQKPDETARTAKNTSHPPLFAECGRAYKRQLPGGKQ
eukprot:1660391-Alexandrium_andersonii.AAC.1